MSIMRRVDQGMNSHAQLRGRPVNLTDSRAILTFWGHRDGTSGIRDMPFLLILMITADSGVNTTGGVTVELVLHLNHLSACPVVAPLRLST